MEDPKIDIVEDEHKFTLTFNDEFTYSIAKPPLTKEEAIECVLPIYENWKSNKGVN